MTAGITTRARGNADIPPLTSPVSTAGLRVRLFSFEDVPQLASKAQRPLAKDARPCEIAKSLNLAFFGAYIAAEQERATLAPADLKEKCDTIAYRARQLLQALELPSDPKSYSREGSRSRHEVHHDPLGGSAIASRIKRTIYDVEPLPSPSLDDQWRNLSQMK